MALRRHQDRCAAGLAVAAQRGELPQLRDAAGLLAGPIRPLPFCLHGSPSFKPSYLFRIPRLAHPSLRLSLLLSKTLSKAVAANPLPKGLKATKLPTTDLARLKEYWLKTEMRDDRWWERFLKTFDVSRQFSVDPKSQAVGLPVSIKAGARENVVLLIRSAEFKRAGPGPLASLTLQQTTTKGELVGGSTYVFNAAKPR